VGEPRLHLTGPGAGEEGQRLPLQMGEELAAQLVHDALAHRGGQPGLDDAEDCGRDRDAHHEADEQEQQPDVLLGDRDVDDLLGEEGRAQPQRGAGDDEAQDHGDRGAVRGEEREHPSGAHRVGGQLGGVLGVDACAGPAGPAVAARVGEVVHAGPPVVVRSGRTR